MNTPRSLAKSVAGRLLWPLAAPLAARRIGGSRGLILMFHYVGDPILPGAHDFLFLSPAVYEAILDFIVARLRPLAPAEFFPRLRAGTLPPGATLLTFDDGTRDQVRAALPPLAARGLQACFFVSPGLMASGRSVPSLDLATLVRHAAAGDYAIDLPPYLEQPGEPLRGSLTDPAARAALFRWRLLPLLMATPSPRQPALLAAFGEALHVENAAPNPYPLATWEELEVLAGAGQYVGSHTLWHSTIAADGAARFAADVADSLAQIEARFPASFRLFCYPYGRPQDATPAAAAILDDLGVDFSLAVQGGLADIQQQGRQRLRRQAVNYSLDALKMAVLMAVAGR